MMSVRLVHLLNEQKRQELMIIYSEDLAPTRLTAKQLQEGGSARSQWPAIEKGLIERARENVKLQQPSAVASNSSRDPMRGCVMGEYRGLCRQ
jgi:hypothetical protein